MDTVCAISKVTIHSTHSEVAQSKERWGECCPAQVACVKCLPARCYLPSGLGVGTFLTHTARKVASGVLPQAQRAQMRGHHLRPLPLG